MNQLKQIWEKTNFLEKLIIASFILIFLTTPIAIYTAQQRTSTAPRAATALNTQTTTTTNTTCTNFPDPTCYDSAAAWRACATQYQTFQQANWCPYEETTTRTPDPQTVCESTGGTWDSLIGNADSCLLAAGTNLPAETGPGCDCGTNSCFDQTNGCLALADDSTTNTRTNNCTPPPTCGTGEILQVNETELLPNNCPNYFCAPAPSPDPNTTRTEETCAPPPSCAAGTTLQTTQPLSGTTCPSFFCAPDTQTSCNPADINQDNAVDMTDYNLLLADFFRNAPPANPRADLSGDGFVEADDYSLFVSYYNQPSNCQ